MFSYEAWIFSGLDMNERLKPGRFPLRADQRRHFLASERLQFLPSYIFLSTISDSRDERCSSHGKESRKGGVDFSSSPALDKHSPRHWDHQEASATGLLLVDPELGWGLSCTIREHLPSHSVREHQPHHSGTEAAVCGQSVSPLCLRWHSHLQSARPWGSVTHCLTWRTDN